MDRLIPYGEDITEFSTNINKLSRSFVRIYNQSEKAEEMGLDEIVGIGYRKSLEFLIKNYSIKINPEKEGAIKAKQLSPCIQDYIDNKRIKALATASAWIGNDETHYANKHDDYGIGHLKAFISSIVSYIDSELSFLEAEILLNMKK